MNHETSVSPAAEVHGKAERALTNFFGAGLVLFSIYVIICYSWNSGFSMSMPMPAFLGKFLVISAAFAPIGSQLSLRPLLACRQAPAGK